MERNGSSKYAAAIIYLILNIFLTELTDLAD
jgi:hypothetical protein